MSEEHLREVGDFRIIREIGRGGSGVVYLAEHKLKGGPPFALKVLSKQPEGGEVIGALREDLSNLAGLSDPHLVEVREIGVDATGPEPVPYLTMDFIAGPTGESCNLKQHREASGGYLPPAEVKRIFLQILAALGEVHDRRVAHLGLKPQNILLDQELNAHVSDVGLAQAMHAGAAGPAKGLASPYAAPEQVEHRTGSRRSDIFAVGVMMLECLTGRRPEVVWSKSEPAADYARPSEFGLSRGWDALLKGCLAIDPAARYASAKALREQVDQLAPGPAVDPSKRFSSKGAAAAETGALTMEALIDESLEENRPHRTTLQILAGLAFGAIVTIGLVVAATKYGPKPKVEPEETVEVAKAEETATPEATSTSSPVKEARVVPSSTPEPAANEAPPPLAPVQQPKVNDIPKPNIASAPAVVEKKPMGVKLEKPAAILPSPTPVPPEPKVVPPKQEPAPPKPPKAAPTHTSVPPKATLPPPPPPQPTATLPHPTLPPAPHPPEAPPIPPELVPPMPVEESVSKVPPQPVQEQVVKAPPQTVEEPVVKIPSQPVQEPVVQPPPLPVPEPPVQFSPPPVPEPGMKVPPQPYQEQPAQISPAVPVPVPQQPVAGEKPGLPPFLQKRKLPPGVPGGESPSASPPVVSASSAMPATSGLPDEVVAARKKANSAQDVADAKAADKYAPSLYQEGQRVYGLGMEALRNERYNAAVQRFGQAVEAFTQAASTSEQARAGQEAKNKAYETVYSARALAAKKKYPEAEQAYKSYLDKFPQDAQVSYEYGEMLMTGVSAARGMQALRKTLELPGLQPIQKATIHAKFADVYHRAGKLEGAIQEVLQAMQSDPQNGALKQQLKQYELELAQRQRNAQQQQRVQQGVIQGIGGSLLNKVLP